MFKNLQLKPTYSSYEDDLGLDFYSPVLFHSIKYDRAAAYFSSSSLASYATGLEHFSAEGFTYRLIISTEISRADYDEIRLGYELKNSTNEILISRLKEKLSKEEERKLSNLAFLVSIGAIEVKIAFTPEGIFHDKFGIAEDLEGNIICFRGSNNETAAAYERNFESFDITCSWQASEFDYAKITKSRDTFDKLWNNDYENICVKSLSGVMYDEIINHSRGRLIMDSKELDENCVVLDMSSNLEIHMNIDPKIIINSYVYKLKIRRYIDNTLTKHETLSFRKNLTYLDFKQIISILESDSLSRGYKLHVTKKLSNYIKSKELYISKRAQLGIAIKNRQNEIIDRFNEYSEIVSSSIERQLREKQMWDSFFLCSMKKASNFSVPGSGKTASVLGAYAYLREKGLIERIVMIGPKNSFESWKDEFELTFGNKLALNHFNIHDSKYKSTFEKKYALIYETGKANLILLNYESLRTYYHEASKLIDDKTLLVFDEIHKVKAISGVNATKAVAIARNSNYTIALTGTPIPNSYADLFNLLDILYHDEYYDFFNFSLQQLKNPDQKDIDCINEKILPFFCRTTKGQLGVPSANSDIIIRKQVSNEENRLFEILCLKYAKNKLALIIRLLQLESNPNLLLQSLDLSDFSDILDISLDTNDIDYVDFSSDVVSLISSIQQTTKFKICLETVLKLWRDGKPVIVWCIFIDSIVKLAAELRSYGLKVGCIYGSTVMDERKKILDSFKSKDIDVLITNPHTLAESVSLHKSCHDAIYFEYSYNLVHLLQSKDRIHRLGLEESQYTQYYISMVDYITDLHETYSLDQQIYDRLREKESTMLDAIEHNHLEQVSTSEDDLETIFSSLNFS